jgi:2'-5' RNA ligase
VNTDSPARIFLAISPPQSVRTDLIAQRGAWTFPRGATPVSDDKLHLTLHFIGNVARERVDELRGALRVPLRPFELRFGTPVLWPHGIAVLEPASIPHELEELHAALARVLSAAALPLEARAYRPHVTMARRAAGAIAPPDGPEIRWQVDSYALMESSGGRYTVLEHYT